MTELRLALGLAGGVILPAALCWVEPGTTAARAFATPLFAALLVGELAERYLFFAAVSRPGMPGGVRA